MEQLQFPFFSGHKGGIIGIDGVEEILEASRINFKEAEKAIPWFS